MYRGDSRSPSRSRSRPRPISRPPSRLPQSRPQSLRPRSRNPSVSRSHSRSRSPGTPPPRAPQSTYRSPRKSRGRQRGYSQPQDKPRKRNSEVTILLCVYHSYSEHWSTAPIRFNPNRINDRQLWTQIRYVFRTDLQKPWRRVLGFKKVKSIVPIGFTPNGVPTKTNPKDFPDAKTFRHAYHHPERIRPDHRWVDWFVEFDASETRQNGLEFVEGLWAEKLAAIAVVFSIAIVVVSVVWCALGGNLQTVFTVMGFVLTLVAAQIALVALYYQVATPGN